MTPGPSFSYMPILIGCIPVVAFLAGAWVGWTAGKRGARLQALEERLKAGGPCWLKGQLPPHTQD